MKSFLTYGLTFVGGLILGAIGGVLFGANIDLSLSNMAKGFVHQTAVESFDAPVNAIDSAQETGKKMKDTVMDIF